MSSPTLDTLPFDVLYIVADYLLSPCPRQRLWDNKSSDYCVEPQAYVTGFKSIASLSSVCRRIYGALNAHIFKKSIQYDYGSVLVRSAAQGNITNIRKALSLGADVDAFEIIWKKQHALVALYSKPHSFLHDHCRVLQVLQEQTAQVDLYCLCTTSIEDVPARAFAHWTPMFPDRHHATDKYPIEMTALHHTILSHNTPAAKLLIETGAALTLHKASQLHTLHISTAHGDLQLVQHILGMAGQDANVRDKLGNTPLHYVAFMAVPGSMIRLLLQHGADINARNNAGESPLFTSLKPGRQTMHMRLGHIAGLNYSSAKALLLAGAIPLPDSLGETPLHQMCYLDEAAVSWAFHDRCYLCETASASREDWLRDRYEVMEMLLAGGNDVEAECSKRELGDRTCLVTPLLLAVTARDVKAVEILLRYGAKADHRQIYHSRYETWSIQDMFYGATWDNDAFLVVRMMLDSGARLILKNNGYTDSPSELWYWVGLQEMKSSGLSKRGCSTLLHPMAQVLLGSEIANEAAKPFLQNMLSHYAKWAHNPKQHSERSLLAFMTQLLESGASLRLQDVGPNPKTRLVKISSKAKLAWQRALDVPKRVTQFRPARDNPSSRELMKSLGETWDLVDCLLREYEVPRVDIVTCLRAKDEDNGSLTGEDVRGKLVVVAEDAP